MDANDCASEEGQWVVDGVLGPPWPRGLYMVSEPHTDVFVLLNNPEAARNLLTKKRAYENDNCSDVDIEYFDEDIGDYSRGCESRYDRSTGGRSSNESSSSRSVSSITINKTLKQYTCGLQQNEGGLGEYKREQRHGHRISNGNLLFTIY